MKVDQIRKGILGFVADTPARSYFTVDGEPFCTATGSFNCLFNGASSAEESAWALCRLLEIAFSRSSGLSCFVAFWNATKPKERALILKRVSAWDVHCSRIYTKRPA